MPTPSTPSTPSTLPTPPTLTLLDLNAGEPNLGVASLQAAAEEAGFDVHVVDVRTGAAIPEGDGPLLVTGGPGSPHGEASDAPWLTPLRAALRRALLDGRPGLFICLGFQIIAGELGATVRRLSQPREGLFRLSGEGTSEALTGAVVAESRGFGVFGGALDVLARGPEGDTLAARLGPRAFGYVFHPEARAGHLEGWAHAPSDPALARALDETSTALLAGFLKEVAP